jgi:hypothetical protein
MGRSSTGPRRRDRAHTVDAGRGIAIASATPPCGIAWLGGEHRQLDVLIAEHSGAAIDRAGVPAGAHEGGRGAGDEDTASLMPARPPLDVEGAAVPHLVGARLGDEQVEHGDVVQCAVADREQRGNRTAPIEHEVKNLPHVHLF